MDATNEVLTGEILPMVLPREEHEARERRGRQIAQLMRIKQVGRHYVVPSQTNPAASYIVDLEEEHCTCQDFETRRVRCKHQHAAEFTIIWQQTRDADGTVTETVVVQEKRKSYPQQWAAYNEAQLNEQPRMLYLLKDLCSGIAEPPRKLGPGRPSKTLRDKLIAAVMKVYSLKSARRAMSQIEDCVTDGYLDESISHNAILGFLQQPSTTPLLMWLVRESAAPLAIFETEGQFAIDSTGFSTVVYERWFDKRYGKSKDPTEPSRRFHEFVKLHAFIGTQTNVVTAVRVTKAADCNQLPALLDETGARFDIIEVSADKAYLSYENLDAIEAAGATPFIPPKVNTKARRSGAWERNRCRFFLAAEEWKPKYHRRSNAEATFHSLKMKFGGAVKAKSQSGQVNEVLCKVIAYNLVCLIHAVYENGLQSEFWPEDHDGGLVVVQ